MTTETNDDTTTAALAAVPPDNIHSTRTMAITCEAAAAAKAGRKIERSANGRTVAVGAARVGRRGALLPAALAEP